MKAAGVGLAAAVVLFGAPARAQEAARPASQPEAAKKEQPAEQPPAPAPGAQPGEPGVPPETPPEPVRFWLLFPASHAFPADIDGGGDVSVTRAGAWLGIEVPFQQYNRFTLEMSAEWSFYDFENATSLDRQGGDPIGAVEEFQIGARVFIRTAMRWGVFGAAELISAGEPGANFSDTLRFTGYAGARYWFSETLSMSAGGSIRTRYEESAFIAPFVTIDWDINGQWSLKTSARVLERGTNVALAYAPSEAWAFSLSAGYEPREYRYDDSGFNPGGSFLEERIPVELGAHWKPRAGFEVSAGVGVNVWQRYQIRDGGGNEVGEETTDPQPFVTLGVEFKF